MKKTIFYLALSGIALTSLNSCDDLENLCNLSEADLGTGEVFVTSLNQMIDIYTRVDNVSKDSVLNATNTNTIDGAFCTLVGDSLIIDFGVSDVLTADGKLRKGSIRTKLTGNYTTVGGKLNAKLSTYFVDGVQIKGTVNAENKGPAANPDFAVSVTEFEVGEDSKVNYTLGMLWQGGFVSPVMTDDVFEVSGTIAGDDNKNAKQFTATFTEPLRYVNACQYFLESGVIDITLTGDTTVAGFEVDFIGGDGCNNLFKATVECQGSPISFTYPFN